MNSQPPPPDRDAIAEEYFERLPYPPYPVQEEALLAYYTAPQGVLVWPPTGTGKTLIAEAAIYEALRTGRRCYYTTPLIALTDQKFAELQASAVRWGYPPESVGLVTGNRRVNGDAPVLVVVAEILMNRLLHPEAFPMDDVLAVVMDEFHCFNDAERGVVWEMSLAFLPKHVRTLLLSATVGNSVDFLSWLHRAHGRNLQLVQGTERKVPLSFRWVDDMLLDEHMEAMFEGDEVTRRTPALLFCFNRDQCWQVAEMLKGKRMVDKPRQAALNDRLDQFDLSKGAGPKLRAILQRGVGVHHAGVLPIYRRIVETLFQEKLLSVAVCTETLSAGINLPARSVVLPTIVKGARNKKRLVEASTAHQIFGRAGRPQFDNEGFVYALAHEDDVKHLRWKEKYDSIPEDTKDPNLLRAKKQLKKKMPKRREGETYWTAAQFEQLRTAASAKLASRGELPWRLLAYLLTRDPAVQPIRDLVGRRLMSDNEITAAQKRLNQMLVTLWSRKFIRLEPPPQEKSEQKGAPEDSGGGQSAAKPAARPAEKTPAAAPAAQPSGLFAGVDLSRLQVSDAPPRKLDPRGGESENSEPLDFEAEDDEAIAAAASPARPPAKQYDLEEYRPERAEPTDEAELLLRLRSVNPVYGVYLADTLLHADRAERILALESVLEMPANVAMDVRVPPPEEMPFGPLASNHLHERLLSLGLATTAEIMGRWSEDEEEEEDERGRTQFGRRPPPPRPLTLGEKIQRLFQHDVGGVYDVKVFGVWAVGELLQFGDFFKWITARGLQKQEGVLFRHALRFIMLCDEIASVPPIGSEPENWEDMFDDLIDELSAICRAVDPESTEEAVANKLSEDELLIGQSRQFRRT